MPRVLFHWALIPAFFESVSVPMPMHWGSMPWPGAESMQLRSELVDRSHASDCSVNHLCRILPSI